MIAREMHQRGGRDHDSADGHHGATGAMRVTG
jgi:hypothetical protein